MVCRCPAILLSALLVSGLHAEEGMWTFDRPPLEQLRTGYQFTPEPAWFDHLRLATVRIGEEGTGSFVSRDGLVLTNQHVVQAFLQALSSPDRDLVTQGFLAPTREQELPIPGLAIRILVASRNVTTELATRLRPGLSRSQAAAARASALEALRQDEAARTGLTCDPVLLGQGGEVWLYSYRDLTDVRLVMAPELDVAAFGKAWDNFSYPRHDLDFSLLRAYEHGRPYHPEQVLTWNRQGSPKGALTVVAGYPAQTHRQETHAHLEFRRRFTHPLLVATLERNQRSLEDYAARSPECARQVASDLLETANFLKVYREELLGLEAQPAMARILTRDRERRARIRRHPEARQLAAGSWPRIQQALRRQQGLAREYQLLHGTHCSLERGALYHALKVVRTITESVQAPDQGLEGYSEEELKALRQELLEAPPLNRDLEALLLRDGLEETRTWLGSGHRLTRAVLGPADPAETARRALSATRIDDPAFLRGLLAGGPGALAACDDPLIRMARNLDPLSREIKHRWEELEASIQEQDGRIQRARLLIADGPSYPDATFTLRLSIGSIQPYEAEGTLQPPFTTFGGLFDRGDAWGPEAEGGAWALPRRWMDRRASLHLATPLNFITTNDITGGSSGSPVVDRNGELIGLVFDGNIHSIPGRFYYDGTRNRCIAVDARAILEALACIYDADVLVKEIAGN